MTRTGERGCSKNAQDSASKDAPASLARTGHANVTQPVPLSPSLHVAESIGLHAESIALHRRYVAMPWKLYATAAVQTPSPLTNTEPKTSLLFFARTGTRKTKTKLIHLISATIMYVFHRVSSNKKRSPTSNLLPPSHFKCSCKFSYPTFNRPYYFKNL